MVRDFYRGQNVGRSLWIRGSTTKNKNAIIAKATPMAQ